MLQGTLGLVHTEQRSASVIEQMKAGGLNPIEQRLRWLLIMTVQMQWT